MYTREQIQSTVEGKGYKYFTDNNNKGYDVNIIGIRNSKTKGRVTIMNLIVLQTQVHIG